MSAAFRLSYRELRGTLTRVTPDGRRATVAELGGGRNGAAMFEPRGGYEHIPFPDPITTNICFGGADMQDASNR